MRETGNRSFGLFAHRTFTPATSGIAHIVITSQKFTRLPMGVEGMLPACCLPLLTAAENKQITGKREFPMKIVIIRYNERRFIVYHCDERRRPKTGRPRGGLND
jgi:hypothetical protein